MVKMANGKWQMVNGESKPMLLIYITFNFLEGFFSEPSFSVIHHHPPYRGVSDD
jgi:hypothetical protein